MYSTLMAAAANDPKVQALAAAERELEALEAKKEPTEAELTTLMQSLGGPGKRTGTPVP
ncbi:MAG: hypothetical protein ACR2LU_02340 [Luteitalea sp.]